MRNIFSILQKSIWVTQNHEVPWRAKRTTSIKWFHVKSEWEGWKISQKLDLLTFVQAFFRTCSQSVSGDPMKRIDASDMQYSIDLHGWESPKKSTEIHIKTFINMISFLKRNTIEIICPIVYSKARNTSFYIFHVIFSTVLNSILSKKTAFGCWFSKQVGRLQLRKLSNTIFFPRIRSWSRLI